MKLLGILILAFALALGAYSLTLDAGVDVPARDLGYGVTTPAMRVPNADLPSQRQNYIIVSGFLSIVGAILLVSHPCHRRLSELDRSTLPRLESADPEIPISVSICPNCRHMGAGESIECARCAAPLTAGSV